MVVAHFVEGDKVHRQNVNKELNNLLKRGRSVTLSVKRVVISGTFASHNESLGNELF